MLRILTVLIALLILSTAHAAEWHDVMSPSKFGEAEIIRGELHLPAKETHGNGPFPAVVLMHGCGGLTPAVKQGLDAHADALNEAGFAALILDSFGPRNLAGGQVCENVDQLVRMRHSRRADAAGAHAFLAERSDIDGANIFLMGQSNGAGTAVLAAQPSFAQATGTDAAFRAVAAFYPWCGSFDSYRLTTPLLILSGSEDGWTPPASCAKRVGKMKGADYQVEVYDGATHSFDLPIERQEYAGQVVAGDAPAALAARARMIAFFRENMAR
ncbi:MAG: dienelactone hydrolase family protein [Rhodospirillales bacterium]